MFGCVFDNLVEEEEDTDKEEVVIEAVTAAILLETVKADDIKEDGEPVNDLVAGDALVEDNSAKEEENTNE